MKKVIQKGIIKVIQPQIVEYYCDKCNKRTGIKGNIKQIVYTPKGDEHYCKKTSCNPFRRRK